MGAMATGRPSLWEGSNARRSFEAKRGEGEKGKTSPFIPKW